MRDIAYEYLKDKILTCEILPGENISEKQVSEVLKTGRTPVRESIITLQNEGLAEVFPRRGTFATTITTEHTVALYQLRKLIEPAVAIQFKQKLDPVRLMHFDKQFEKICDQTGRESDIAFYKLDIQFHNFIVGSAENPLLQHMFDDLMQATYRLGMYSLTQNLQNPKDKTCKEHQRIIQAVLMEDDLEIQNAYIDHINRSRISALKTLAP